MNGQKHNTKEEKKIMLDALGYLSGVTVEGAVVLAAIKQDFAKPPSEGGNRTVGFFAPFFMDLEDGSFDKSSFLRCFMSLIQLMDKSPQYRACFRACLSISEMQEPVTGDEVKAGFEFIDDLESLRMTHQFHAIADEGLSKGTEKEGDEGADNA